MNTTPRTSIIGLAVAQNLIAQLDRKERVATFHNARFSMSARVTEAGTVVLWGWMNGPTYGHSCGARTELPRTYLRNPDTHVSAINAKLTEMIQREAAERPLRQAREAVYQLAESREIPDAWAEPSGAPIDAPQDYDAMTLEHCAAWMPILQALPVKPAAVAA